MKFALLGWNPKIAPLLRAIAANAEHQMVLAAEIPQESLGELLETSPGIRVLGDWEELLVDTAADVTIVAGHSESVQAGAKQLAVDERRLALAPQASQGSAFVYELTLTHDDNQVPLVPIPDLVVHPLVTRLQKLIDSGDLGQIMLQRVERSIEADGSSGPSIQGLTREEVDAALFVDVPLLRFLGGNYNRITAVHSGPGDSEITLATVTLGGNDLAEATWTARAGKPAWSLEVTGSLGSATLTLDESRDGALAVNLTSVDSNVEVTGTEAPAHEALANENVDRLGQCQLEALLKSLEDPSHHWAEMTRAFETVEATHTSLRRRRTIDLFFETTSERSIFKSQMTAVGCGLILLTLLGLVAFLLLGAFVDSNSRLQKSAQADNRVVRNAEFISGTAQLNAAGLKHVSEIAGEARRSAETVFVMPANDDMESALNSERIAAVAATLAEAGHADSAAFVQLASVPHPLMLLSLKLLRVLWIAPLILFLLMQSLLFVTRPSSNQAFEE